MFSDGTDDVEELDATSERVAMVDDGHAVGPVPTVQLYTTAAHAQTAHVRLHRRLARELVPSQVPTTVEYTISCSIIT